jgi:hypothetical protein
MNAIVGCSAVLVLAASLLMAAEADTPKPTEADARANIEAQLFAKAQAKCAKDGKVALADHVNGAFMVKCVSPDDPEYKAQQAAKPAH